MRKFFDSIISFVCACGVFYFVYQAIYNHDGMIAVVLRIIAALIMAFIVVIELKEMSSSKKDLVREWYIKDEPNGMFVYLIKYGVLFSGIGAGYISWIFIVDFDNTPDLFLSAIKHMVPLSVGGVFGAWLSWKSNVSKASELDLDQGISEEDL